MVFLPFILKWLFIFFRYFIASQDPDMRTRARKVPGTPILFLYMSAPTLEKPSGMSNNSADQNSSHRMETDYQSAVLNELKRKELGENADDEARKRKRKRKKGPNPLSCLKSKKKKPNAEASGSKPKSGEAVNPDEAKKKRKRVRKRGKKNEASTPAA